MYFPIIDVLKENFIAKIPSIVTQWLTDNVDPVGSAVVVDESLSISGAAADAKITGDEINDLKSDFSDTAEAINDLSALEEQNLLLDEAWEVGSLNTSNGSNLTSLTRIRTIDYIDIQDTNELVFTIASGYKYVVDWYDADKVFKKVGIATVWQTTSQTVQVPDNVAYMRLIVSRNPDDYLNADESINLRCKGTTKLTKSVNSLLADSVNPLRANVTRVTSTSVLGDLDNAAPNVIYNISSILHSILHIPSTIPSTIVNATVWTLAGEISATTNWRVQFISSGATTPELYFRTRMNNQWRAWQKLLADANIEVVNANIDSLNYYNSTAVNKLEIGSIQNKNVLTFGDSITAGNTDTSWTYHFAQMTGGTVTNKAVAGASFGESLAESSAKYISTQITNTPTTEWNNADIIIVSAGTNDGLINTPHSELKEKVLSAITAIKAATDKPIIFITPIRRNTPTYSENLKLPLIAGIISNVALSNGCNVICGYDFPIPSETIDEITNVTRDGLHPNATGANIYARAVINALV